MREESQWQAKIISQFAMEHRTKYMAGAVEHKENGLLQDIPPEKLLDFAIEEVLDLVSYLYTMREQITTTNELSKTDTQNKSNRK